MASVFPVPCFLFKEPGPDEVVQGALDGAAGKLQVGGDGVYRRPAVLSLPGTILEVHIYRPGPMRQLIGRGGINRSKIAHAIASFRF